MQCLINKTQHKFENKREQTKAIISIIKRKINFKNWKVSAVQKAIRQTKQTSIIIIAIDQKAAQAQAQKRSQPAARRGRQIRARLTETRRRQPETERNKDSFSLGNSKLKFFQSWW